MKIGVPREIKDQEFRVGLHPAAVHVLREAGHEVVVERGAGAGSSMPDRDYESAGATIVADARAVYEQAELVVKVKEPLAPEYELLRPGQILFTFLHLAPVPELTDVLLERRVTGIAYETIEDRNGRLPLLTPMSEIAGRMAVMVGSFYLQRNFGGRGALLSGVPGVPPGDVAIVGGGVVGLNAAKIAVGLGAARGGARLQPRPPALARRHLPRRAHDAGVEPSQPAGGDAPRRHRDRRRAHPRRLGAQADHARRCSR